MDQEHDNVEAGNAAVVTGDQPEGLPAEMAEGADSIRVADEDDDEPEETEVEAEASGDAFVSQDPTMLLGETRDHVLDAFKRSAAWKGLGEKEQRYLANEVEQACRRIIIGAVRATASMDLDAVEVTVSKPTLTDKDQIEAKVTCPFDPDTWAALPSHRKRMLVFASSERLMGARAAAVMKDQPGLFPEETPEQRKAREATEFEAKEREASIARARQIKPLDDDATLGGEAGKIVGDMMPPKLKAAMDRGIAHRQDGGAFAIPKDLEGKPSEVNAWTKGWEAADRQAGVSGESTPQAEAIEPAKAPRGHRGKHTTAEERTAKRLASVDA